MRCSCHRRSRKGGVGFTLLVVRKDSTWSEVVPCGFEYLLTITVTVNNTLTVNNRLWPLPANDSMTVSMTAYLTYPHIYISHISQHDCEIYKVREKTVRIDILLKVIINYETWLLRLRSGLSRNGWMTFEKGIDLGDK